MTSGGLVGVFKKRTGNVVGTSFNSYNTNSANVWVQLFGAGAVHGGETAASYRIRETWKVTNMQVMPVICSKDGQTDLILRDDTADTAAEINLAAGASTLHELNNLSIELAAGSLVSTRIDTSASISGNLACIVYYAYEVIN